MSCTEYAGVRGNDEKTDWQAKQQSQVTCIPKVLRTLRLPARAKPRTMHQLRGGEAQKIKELSNLP